jgi:hypothetical protein
MINFKYFPTCSLNLFPWDFQANISFELIFLHEFWKPSPSPSFPQPFESRNRDVYYGDVIWVLPRLEVKFLLIYVGKVAWGAYSSNLEIGNHLRVWFNTKENQEPHIDPNINLKFSSYLTWEQRQNPVSGKSFQIKNKSTDNVQITSHWPYWLIHCRVY